MSFMHEDITLPNKSAYCITGAAHRHEIDDPEEKSAGIIIFTNETAWGPTSHNVELAKILNKNKLATLIPAPSGPPTGADAFAQAEQLRYVARWVRKHPPLSQLPIGYFGTGAAAEAALIAATNEPGLVQAIVLRGNHPDEFAPVLATIKAPVLLIAPGRNQNSIRASQLALGKLNEKSAINIISAASASFQEPGVLEESAHLASLWFLQHMA